MKLVPLEGFLGEDTEEHPLSTSRHPVTCQVSRISMGGIEPNADSILNEYYHYISVEVSNQAALNKYFGYDRYTHPEFVYDRFGLIRRNAQKFLK